MVDQIIHGDSISEIKKIKDNSIHAIISDIPYGICFDEWDVLHSNSNSALGGSSFAQQSAGNIFKRRGKPLNGWSNADKKIPQEYQEWCATWAADWLRVLKPGASCFIFAGRRLAHRCISALEDCGFTFKDMLAWEKNSAPCRAQRISETYKRREDSNSAEIWKGWRVANLRPVFEPILWFQKPYKTGATLADNILEYGVGAWNEAALQEYNLYDIARSDTSFSNIIKVEINKTDHGLHEAQKPLQLMKLLITFVTSEGDIILDPFMGSGTTCLAAKHLNRRYIGIDFDEKNIITANERLDGAEEFRKSEKSTTVNMSLFDMPDLFI